MGRTPVIIDTDPGVDDTLALLLALASPEIEVLAIIISFGNTDAKSSYVNILKIYQSLAQHVTQFPQDVSRFPGLTPKRKPILAMGEDHPLQGDLHSAQYFHGRDGLAGITQRHPDLNVDDENPTSHPQLQFTQKSGVEVALELIKSEPGRTITYLALGPLTNLAKALRVDRDTVRDRIGRVVCMGGALDVPGNTSPVAEFNFFADPFAVKELLMPDDPGHGIPLNRFLLPLDVTTPHELSFPYYKEAVDPAFSTAATPSRAAGKAPLVHFTSAFLERTREVMVEFGKDAMELHDIAAFWCALDNPPVLSEASPDALPTLREGWKATKRKFDIERFGELTRGMLVVDRRDDQGAYAPGSNRAEVQAELERHHFKHSGAYESTANPARVEIESPPSTTAKDQPQDAVSQTVQAQNGGVPCVTQTPGSAALVKLLLERVWGIPVKA
ncbi:nucleoside hydrolase [Trametes meyenii]|nr:nucleoside hydrolase [Trametes meyenii]